MSDNPETVLILGGYGTFGGRIAQELCARGKKVIINGRSQQKALIQQRAILDKLPTADITVACFDVYTELKSQLQKLSPRVVIHTCGPFQGQDTAVAKTIITAGIHYIDLADGRDYVQHMLALNQLAIDHQVTAITAASTVPALSSAVLTNLKNEYAIESFTQVNIGISPGQKTDRGLATTQAVLSYIGKPLKPWPGGGAQKYGWQNSYKQKYPAISARMMGNCEAPDLDLFAAQFNIKRLHFSAGMESKLLHVLIWMSSWLVRLGLPVKLNKHARKLLKISRWFDVLGTANGGMHVDIEGLKSDQSKVAKTWFIEAFNNEGPQIPAMPAVIMTEKLLSQQISCGVQPCVNLITLNEYLSALGTENIQTTTL